MPAGISSLPPPPLCHPTHLLGLWRIGQLAKPPEHVGQEQVDGRALVQRRLVDAAGAEPVPLLRLEGRADAGEVDGGLEDLQGGEP
jgi:hypothetical protein